LDNLIDSSDTSTHGERSAVYSASKAQLEQHLFIEQQKRLELEETLNLLLQQQQQQQQLEERQTMAPTEVLNLCSLHGGHISICFEG
jgi:hypothetical protein